MDSSQARLLLRRSHESQSVGYLQFLPQTTITVGKYRAMSVDKYEYCRGVQDMHCPGGASPLPADCPEFIAAIQFNRRLQFSRLPLPGQAGVKYPTANSDKIAPRERMPRCLTHSTPVFVRPRPNSIHQPQG